MISRDVGNTRPRDYYDLHMLWLARQAEVKPDVLREALEATAGKRGTIADMGKYHEVMERVSGDDEMLARWSAYARRYPYVGDLMLQKTCETVTGIMAYIGWKSNSQ